MTRLILITLSFIMLIACAEKKNEEKLMINKKDLQGVWSSESDNEFFIFKDSVVLPFDFYLYTNWKLDKNKIQVYALDTPSDEDSIWAEYIITDFSKDSMSLVSSVLNLDSSEVTFYRKNTSAKQKIDFINLKREVYPDEESIFEIEINSNGEVSFKEVTRNNEKFLSKCYFDSLEMNVLNTMVDQIVFSETNKNYISGISDQNYYTLEMASLFSRDTLQVTVDTGNVSPNMLSRVITFIWATTKLKCTPSRYNNWRMYYNPIYPL